MTHTSQQYSEQKQGHHQRGFTLVEIIVSLAIFTIVAVVAVGAFLKIIDANKQSQLLQTAMNNVNFALESIVREMRVGSTYACYNDNGSASTYSTIAAQSCPVLGSVNNAIAFKSSISGTYNPNQVNGTTGQPLTCKLIHAYRYVGDATHLFIEKAEQKYCDDRIGDPVTAPFVQLTAADLKVDTFKLKVDSASATIQPKVFILMTGHTGTTDKNKEYFTVQTTASQRSMN
jgi:prepilin-type N-terminal cleavage/methylation domain-containing protein